jgi:hypothetical protein
MKFLENNRKVAIGLFVITVAIAVDLLALKGLTDNVKELLEFVSVGFFLTNSVTHVAAALKPKTPGQMEDHMAIKAQAEELKAQNEVLAKGVNNIQQILQAVIKK